MALIKSCCCCSLRTGTLIIGWCETIGGLIGIIFTIVMMVLLGSMDVEITENITTEEIVNNSTVIKEDYAETIVMGKAAYAFMIMILIGIFIYYLCFTTLAVFLLVGVHKQNMRFVKLWVQIKSVLLILALIGIILQMFLMLFEVDSSVNEQVVVAALMKAHTKRGNTDD